MVSAKKINVSFRGLEMRILVHSPANLSICFCTVNKYVQVQTSSTPAQSDISGWRWLNQRRCREFLQKRTLNIIFPVGEYATNLIIANVETQSHDDSNWQLFFRWSWLEFGGLGPLAASLDPPLVR